MSRLRGARVHQDVPTLSTHPIEAQMPSAGQMLLRQATLDDARAPAPPGKAFSQIDGPAVQRVRQKLQNSEGARESFREVARTEQGDFHLLTWVAQQAFNSQNLTQIFHSRMRPQLLQRESPRTSRNHARASAGTSTEVRVRGLQEMLYQQRGAEVPLREAPREDFVVLLRRLLEGSTACESFQAEFTNKNTFRAFTPAKA